MILLFSKHSEFNYEDNIPYKRILFYINDGEVIVCDPIDDFDMLNIENWKIGVFNIQYLNFESAHDFIFNTTRHMLIMEESGNLTLLNPDFDEVLDHTNILDQPYNTWIWSKTNGRWEPPTERPVVETPLRVFWNKEWGDWEISYGRKDLPRLMKSYQIWFSEEMNGSSIFHDACSTRDYMIKPFENITHGTRDIENLIKTYNKQIEDVTDSPRPYMSINGHVVVIDLSPIAIITYSECHENATSMFNQLYSMHPQFLSRTPHELFRLIIEWAYSHTDLGNNELAATTCHKILQAVQMPKSIRDELLSLPPQQVGGYLEGQVDALIENETYPEASTDFNKWINKIYYHYPHLKKGQEPHIDQLPATYPV